MSSEAKGASDQAFNSFGQEDLQQLLSSCQIPPAVNQIYLSPNNIARVRSTLTLAAAHDVLVEAYWMLRSLTDEDPQPLVDSVGVIAARHNVTPDQVILAWGRSLGWVLPSD